MDEGIGPGIGLGGRRATYLSDDVAWLKIAEGLHELSHRAVEITLAVEIVTVTTMNVGHARFVNSLRSGETDCESVQVPPIQHLEFGRGGVFIQSR